MLSCQCASDMNHLRGKEGRHHPPNEVRFGSIVSRQLPLPLCDRGAESLEIHLRLARLRIHLLVLFLQVMSNVLTEHRDLGIVVIVPRLHTFELRNERFGGFVLNVGLVHQIIIANDLADGWVVWIFSSLQITLTSALFSSPSAFILSNRLNVASTRLWSSFSIATGSCRGLGNGVLVLPGVE